MRIDPTKVFPSETVKRLNPQLFVPLRKPQEATGPSCEVVSESKLHDQIMEWCDSQWPRWKYIHARMDKKSTIGVGIHDLTIFGPYPICILVECKSRDGKIRPKQLEWITEMQQLGWTVHVIRTMDEFRTIVTEPPSAALASSTQSPAVPVSNL